MKRFALYLTITAFVFAPQLINAQKTISDLAGKWESTDGTTTGSIEFLEGSQVQAVINGLQIPPTNYTIDFARTPIWFDVNVAGKMVKGLLDFIDDDTVKYQVFLSGNRSYDFTESENDPIMVMKRKK
jgi:hypothetical protein